MNNMYVLLQMTESVDPAFMDLAPLTNMDQPSAAGPSRPSLEASFVTDWGNSLPEHSTNNAQDASSSINQPLAQTSAGFLGRLAERSDRESSYDYLDDNFLNGTPAAAGAPLSAVGDDGDDVQALASETM
jgi:hypothetical protein